MRTIVSTAAITTTAKTMWIGPIIIILYCGCFMNISNTANAFVVPSSSSSSLHYLSSSSPSPSSFFFPHHIIAQQQQKQQQQKQRHYHHHPLQQKSISTATKGSFTKLYQSTSSSSTTYYPDLSLHLIPPAPKQPTPPPSQQPPSSDPPLVSLITNDATLRNKFTLASIPEQDYIELQVGQRLVCIGDVHGDYEALQDLLTVAGVYDKYTNSWCGGNTIVVQCGDVLDRWSEELKCLELLSKLSHEAQQYYNNGKLIVLLGNHEVLNAMGLFQYATTDYEYEQVIGPIVDKELLRNFHSLSWRAQYLGNQPARWATYEPGGLLAQSLLANMKVAIQVGKTVCVHAGLTADHIYQYGGIASMNQQARDWFLFNQHQHHHENQNNFGTFHNTYNDYQQSTQAAAAAAAAGVKYNHKGIYSSYRQQLSEAEARQLAYMTSAPGFLDCTVGGATSPIWMRDYTAPNDLPPKNPKAQKMIDDALQAIGNDAQRMVMGHTVQRRINVALNGKAWRVDVGASKGVLRGPPEVLEIIRIDEEGNEEVNILTATTTSPSTPPTPSVSYYNSVPTPKKVSPKEREVFFFTSSSIKPKKHIP